jgi:hypothetical protein
MAEVMFEVARTSTFPLDFSLSICVKRQLTTLIASLGSLPDKAADLAAVIDSTSSKTVK